MQSVSFTQIGIFIACVIIAVGLALALKLLFRRDPPLHKEYISRDEHAAFAKKMDEELGRERGQRKKIHEEIANLQTGVEVVKTQNIAQSEALTQMRGEQAAIRQEIKADTTAVQNRIGDVFTALGEIKGRLSK